MAAGAAASRVTLERDVSLPLLTEGLFSEPMVFSSSAVSLFGLPSFVIRVFVCEVAASFCSPLLASCEACCVVELLDFGCSRDWMR